MKTFILLYHGYLAPSADEAAAWEAWFQRRMTSFVDVGHAFGPGRQVTVGTTIEWSLATNPTSGYSIVSAPHIDAAEQLLEGCPIVQGVSLFEALPTDHPVMLSNRARFFEWPRPRSLNQTNREEEDK